jgi:tetratricopeptide (TPR) repeat protein
MATSTFPQYQHEIGARMARGDWTGAAGLAAECRILWPGETDGWVLGSMAALFADQKEQALALVDDRLSRDPGNTPCMIQRAECLFALGRRDDAIDAAESAASTARDVPPALDAIATFLVFAQDQSRAVRIYDMAIAAGPADPSLYSKRAVVHQYLGHFDQAARDFATALSLAPGDAESLKGLADLQRQTPENNHLPAMRAALAAVAADAKDAGTLHFALAKTYEDLVDYSTSWQHLSAANRCERSRLQYVPTQDRIVFERIMGAFPHTEASTVDSTGESPIFIVGLPRTGTTLVERIIGSHSAVHSAGELSALTDAITVTGSGASPLASTTWLGLVEAMGALRGEPIAREYLARTRSQRGNRARFSDKAPANFFYCPLILRAFPQARIVHLTRHPMAACYAIYKTRFNGGYPFAYDLLELADFYCGYRRLMAHWHRVLPGRILDVAYEDVVTRLEPATRRILDYLGLPFEDACLNFHSNPNPSSTSSSVQVRQPLYDSSLQLWRHYSRELGPLRERLVAGGIPADELQPSLNAPG